MTRILALLSKEFADLRLNPGVFLPALLTGLIALLLPFVVAIVVPWLAGEQLSDSSDFKLALEIYKMQPLTTRLDPEGAIQAWIFQQFLLLLVMAPVASSMSVAAFSVIGEKQARTLEPLLATPITTFELLAAKVLSSLLPAIGLTIGLYLVEMAAIAVTARPGVFWILLAPRSLAVVFALGPLAALAALQLAVYVSSRVNDARSAQQIGALIILPIAALLVAQLVGTLVVTTGVALSIAAGLVLANLSLMGIGLALFERESILTRWK